MTATRQAMSPFARRRLDFGGETHMIRGSASGGLMYAILRAGGKQLKVSPGDVVRIETPSDKVSKGETLTLSDVLLVGGDEGKDPRGGSGISVKATVLGPIRTKKVLVFKKKR